MLRNGAIGSLSLAREGAAGRVETSRSPVDAIAITERPLGRAAYAGLSRITGVLANRWELTIEGVDRLPSDGPAIIAANHVSFLDSPLLMFQLPRRVWFLGKAEYLNSPISRTLFPALGMIPLDRDGGRAALTALRSGLGVLDAGQLLGVYPEGTRSRDGRLYRGHTGLAWLALKSEAPIIPVGIRGTDIVQPPGSRLPKLEGSCSINIGHPLDTTRYPNSNRKTQRLLTDDVMFDIAQLSGQHYHDRYAEAPAATATAEGT